MNFEPGDTVVKFWAGQLDRRYLGRSGDWLCILASTKEGELRGEYRFRYHNEVGFDDDLDKVSRTSFRGPADSPEARAKFDLVVGALLEVTPWIVNVQVREVNGDAHAFTAALLDLPGWQVSKRLAQEKP